MPQARSSPVQRSSQAGNVGSISIMCSVHDGVRAYGWPLKCLGPPCVCMGSLTSHVPRSPLYPFLPALKE
jgi:hypothetical protein